MNSTEAGGAAGRVLFVAIGLLMIGHMIGSNGADDRWQKALVQRGLAHYTVDNAGKVAWSMLPREQLASSCVKCNQKLVNSGEQSSKTDGNSPVKEN